MRTKHKNDPSKFLASELALDDHLNKMSALATRPDFLGAIAQPLIEALAPLILHDNDDISRDVLGLIRELAEPDNYEGDARESAIQFVDGLMDADMPSAMVQNIARATEVTLAIFDNLCQIYPTAGPDHLSKKTTIIPWLLQSAQGKTGQSEDLSVSSSELLAIILSGSETACDIVGKPEGLDALLVAAVRWKKRDPGIFVAFRIFF